MTDKPNFKEAKEDVIRVSNENFQIAVSEIKVILEANEDALHGVQPLIKYTLDRVSTTVALTIADKLWDAEIIFRSVLEAFSKFMYIMTQDSQQAYEERLDEYWTQLQEVERVRQSDKAKVIVQSDRIMNLDMFQKMILSDEEERELKSKPAWDKRSLLKNNWSFSDILLGLIKNKDMQPMISFELLQFYYKMSSHVAHADRVAMTAMANRLEIPTLKENREMTHYLKFIKAVTIIPYWMLMEIAMHVQKHEEAKRAFDMCVEYSQYMTKIHIPFMDDLNNMTDELLEANTPDR